MKRIIVIGCPGSGKSTFARRLRDKTGLPLYYLDMIYHKPDRTCIPREEFDKKLSEILEKDEWIIDGNYNRTLEMRMEKCDTVFFLDLPTHICLASAEQRVGKKREDMPWIEREFDAEFKDFIKTFSDHSIGKIYELLEKYNSKNIVIFKTREQVDAFFDN